MRVGMGCFEARVKRMHVLHTLTEQIRPVAIAFRTDLRRMLCFITAVVSKWERCTALFSRITVSMAEITSETKIASAGRERGGEFRGDVAAPRLCSDVARSSVTHQWHLFTSLIVFILSHSTKRRNIRQDSRLEGLVLLAHESRRMRGPGRKSVR